MDEYVDVSDPRDRFLFMLFERLVALEDELESQRAEAERQRAEVEALREAARIAAIPAGKWLLHHVYFDCGAWVDMAAAMAAVAWPPGAHVWYRRFRPAGGNRDIEGTSCVKWLVALRKPTFVVTADWDQAIAKSLSREIDARMENGRVRRIECIALPFEAAPNELQGCETFVAPAV